jgi:hypothetical protein
MTESRDRPLLLATPWHRAYGQRSACYRQLFTVIPTSPSPLPDSGPLRAALATIEAFAVRLPAGACEDYVRRSILELLAAADQGSGVEEAVRDLVAALHQLDEDQVGGLRREYQRNAPALGRLLESIQEEVLPALRHAGYHV